MGSHVAYVETPAGIYKEVDGAMSGPFTREEVGLVRVAVPGCQTLRCGFAEGASVSFGFGYGVKVDNRFEDAPDGASVGPFPAEPAPGSAEAVAQAAGTIQKLAGVVVFLVALLLPGVAVAKTIGGVPRVVDGDTVEVAGERVRLFGIDAPELGQACRRPSGAEWHCGWASAVRLEELIAGRPVRCEGAERDRYGRLVARCFVGAPQVDLGGWLVARGLAVAYRKYSAAYVGQEGAAHADRLGLWSGAFVAPWDWRKGVR